MYYVYIAITRLKTHKSNSHTAQAHTSLSDMLCLMFEDGLANYYPFDYNEVFCCSIIMQYGSYADTDIVCIS